MMSANPQSPRYRSSCSGCQWLGSWDGHDLYYCTIGGIVLMKGAVREECRPDQVGEPRRHPALAMAKRRAVKAGLIAP